MNTFSKLFAGVSLAVLSVASATAADLPSRRAPAPYIAPPPVFTWSGIYVGINAGAAFSNNNNNNNNFAFGFNNNSSNRVGFIGGGQVGYNWQTGPVVFGLEVDEQYRSSLSNNNGGFGGNNNVGSFLGTVRGRLGYAVVPTFMLYATGGLAYGHTDNTANNFFLFNNTTNRRFGVGYTVGGGAEYMFAPNWSVKAEYLFTDLGRNNNNNAFFFNNNSTRFQFHTARVGVNYHFNWGGAAPVVARY